MLNGILTFVSFLFLYCYHKLEAFQYKIQFSTIYQTVGNDALF